MIELKDINVEFKIKGKKVQAVKDVNLKINKGEIFGIVGLVERERVHLSE